MTTSAQSWATEIVGQMSTEDREEIIARGDADAWREGISMMTWDASEGPRPATADVLAGILVALGEMYDE